MEIIHLPISVQDDVVAIQEFMLTFINIFALDPLPDPFIGDLLDSSIAMDLEPVAKNPKKRYPLPHP